MLKEHIDNKWEISGQKRKETGNRIIKRKYYIFLQQIETVQKVGEPLQDAILKFDKLAAKLEGENKDEAKACLEDVRKSDKLLRERLFYLQVQSTTYTYI